MRTIQMTLDDDLVKTVDKIARELKTTRSAFTRHRQGYALYPVNKDEFSVWEKEQNWGDE